MEDETTPAIGDTAICRTCRKPIVWETRTDPGYLPRTGWSDQYPKDAFVCFSALNYAHVPQES